MIRVVLGLGLALTACTPPVSESLPVPPSAPLVSVPVRRKPLIPPASMLRAVPKKSVLIHAFDAARARELDTVMSPSITPEAIARIRAADREARDALDPLATPHSTPSERSLRDADAALGALGEALDDAGQQ